MANRSDNLDRPGSVPLGGSTPSDGLGVWSDLTGSFSTATDGGSGEVVAFETSVAAGENLAALDCGAADHEAAAEIIRADDHGGVTARLVDVNNFYFFRAASGGATELWKKVGGSYTKLADGSLTFTPAVGHTLSIKAVGTSIIGYVNGVDATTGQWAGADADLATGTKAGVYSNGSFQFFNGLTITDLSGGGGVTADLSVSLADSTLSASAAVAVAASSSPTLGGSTLSSGCLVAVACSSSSTLAGSTLGSAATAAVLASCSATLAGSTLSADCTVAVAGGVAAALAVTLGGSTLVSAAAVTVSSSLAGTLAGSSLSCGGSVAVASACGVTLAGSTPASAGSVLIAAALSKMLRDSTLASSVTTGTTPGGGYYFTNYVIPRRG